MITLHEWLELVGYKIVEGYDYMWDCYGKDAAYGLIAGNMTSYSTDIIFCKETHEVREVVVSEEKTNRKYRLVDPNFIDAMYEEASIRLIETSEDFYIDLETSEDFLEKANAIIKGIEYDDRISIPLDMSDAELLIMMRAAHALDITFNQFVEMAVTEAIKDIQ